MDLLVVFLQEHCVFEFFQAVAALGQIGDIHGRLDLHAHVETQMFHKLDVVHKDFTAYVALERHIRLKLIHDDLKDITRVKKSTCVETRALNYLEVGW